MAIYQDPPLRQPPLRDKPDQWSLPWLQWFSALQAGLITVVTGGGGGGGGGGSSTDNAIVRWDGTSATQLQDSPVTLSDVGAFTAPAIAAPATPAAGKGSVYVDSTSKNLAVKDDAGVVKHGVQTKAVVAGQFVTGIADDGSVSTAAASGGGSWIPLVDGSEPPNFITDGAGHLILVAGP